MHPTDTHTPRRLTRAVFLPRLLPAICALAAIALPERASAQAPTFNTVQTTYTNSSYNYPNGSTAGDFNGDGKQDVLVTDNGAIRMMLGNGDGTFTEHDLSVTWGGKVAAADLNGDGRLDAVVVRPQGSLDPVVLLNTGNDANGVPQFTVTDYTPMYGGIRSVTVGDVDGNGSPDFIVGNAYGTLQVYLNNGSGVFTPGQSYTLTPGQGGPAVGPGVIADFNGDGKADYLVTSNQNHAANLLLGNGDGTFQAPVAVANTADAVSVAVADLNGDGKPDFVVGNTDGTVGVFINAGGGAFDTPALYSVGTYSVSSVAIADMNGDRKLDVVASNYWNYGIQDPANTVSVLLGNGDGTFGAANLYPTNWEPTDLSVADFNADGKPDIESLGYRDKNVGVLLNTTPAALPTQTLTILGGSGSVGEVAANVEYYNPATGGWQPAYLCGSHPWGFVLGTDSWINYKPSNVSDPGAGPTTNQTLWYLYRVRFTVPSDAVNPHMTFSLKADNFAQVAINGVAAGGSPTYINNTWMNNVITGTADGVNADAVFSQAVHPGENTITINVGDFGGLNGFNFRIDLSMQSSQPLQIVPSDTTPPVITAPADITAEATSAAGAVVTYTATALDNVDGPVPVSESPASGSTFPIGTTVVHLAAHDAAGNTATASFNVTVRDTTPPVITSVTPSTATLWPPNHAMVAVSINAVATDNVGVTSLKIVSVSCNEPDNARGDGNTTGDVQITGDLTLNLRAERSGTGIGRTYTITVEASDAAGNTATKTCTVFVPKSLGRS